MKKNDFRSLAKMTYDAMRSRSLSINEIVEMTGVDPDYARVLVGRWLRKDVVRRGAIREGRMTYTARGAANTPAFVSGRGRGAFMIAELCQKKWHTAKQLIAATGLSDSTIRRHLQNMVAKRKLAIEIREGGLYHYRVK